MGVAQQVSLDLLRVSGQMKYKRQHIVSNCYLTAWLEPVPPSGQQRALWKFAKNGSGAHRRSPKKTFTETDRYTVILKNGERDLKIEHRLDQIEHAYSLVFRCIQRREKLNAWDKARLAVFTAAMMGRTRRRADHWKEQWTKVREDVFAYQGGSEASEASESVEDNSKLPPGAVRVPAADINQLLLNANPDFVATSIEISAPILFEMDLSFYSTDDPIGFITSDEPCIVHNPTAYRYDPMMRGPGLLQQDVQVLLPLSPRLLVVFSHTRTYPYVTPLTTEQTNDINRMLIHTAHEEIVSWQPEVREEWFSFEDQPLPADAWKPDQGDAGDIFTPIEGPKMVDLRQYPKDDPFQRR